MREMKSDGTSVYQGRKHHTLRSRHDVENPILVDPRIPLLSHDASPLFVAFSDIMVGSSRRCFAVPVRRRNDFLLSYNVEVVLKNDPLHSQKLQLIVAFLPLKVV